MSATYAMLLGTLSVSHIHCPGQSISTNTGAAVQLFPPDWGKVKHPDDEHWSEICPIIQGLQHLVLYHAHEAHLDLSELEELEVVCLHFHAGMAGDGTYEDLTLYDAVDSLQLTMLPLTLLGLHATTDMLTYASATGSSALPQLPDLCTLALYCPDGEHEATEVSELVNSIDLSTHLVHYFGHLSVVEDFMTDPAIEMHKFSSFESFCRSCFQVVSEYTWSIT